MSKADELDPMELALLENARLTAILYSIFKRHPDMIDWSLALEDVDQDIPPDPIIVGWNIIGSDAIITLAFGETLEAMKQWPKNSQSTEDKK